MSLTINSQSPFKVLFSEVIIEVINTQNLTGPFQVLIHSDMQIPGRTDNLRVIHAGTIEQGYGKAQVTFTASLIPVLTVSFPKDGLYIEYKSITVFSGRSALGDKTDEYVGTGYIYFNKTELIEKFQQISIVTIIGNVVGILILAEGIYYSINYTAKRFL